MIVSDEQLKKIWEDTLVTLEQRVSSVSLEVWIKTLQPYAFETESRVFYIIAPSEQSKKTIDDGTFKGLILSALKENAPGVAHVQTVTSDKLPALSGQTPADIAKMKAKFKILLPADDTLLINKNYIFNYFVTGKSNQVAFHAAKSVAASPGSLHNPFFLYGGVGLGKTHLIQAIGNEILENKPTTKILYITSEQFHNDFMDSLWLVDSALSDRQRINLFRSKYRQTDVLIIDDIQFLEKQKATQDALFHTYNDLIQFGKQVIFTSDRHPKDIKGINERLVSRFQSGLTVDINPPDFETRVQILKFKAQRQDFYIPDNIIEFIAENIINNIRELEGALSKVIFFCNLNNKKPDNFEIIKEAIKDYLEPTKADVSMSSIATAVALFFGITKSELLGKSKTKNIAEARQYGIYLSSLILGAPLTSIGEFYGGRDHTTVMYSRDKVTDLIKKDHAAQRKLDDLRNSIFGI